MSTNKIITVLFVTFFYVPLLACPVKKKAIPNSIDKAGYNAQCFAEAINKGKKIKINNTYYVSACNIPINKDIVITGKGEIIVVGSDVFTVNSPISIKIKGVTISTKQQKKYNSQTRFIVSQKQLYHKEVCFENCTIDGVRVYTQVASDVDQATIKDGVRRFVFQGNRVNNTGYFVVRLGNCLCEEAVIRNNEFYRMQSSLFDFGVDNDYRHLSFCRLKRVLFNNNIIDNTGYLVEADYDFLYCTPIMAECDYAECKGNTFKSIIYINEKPIALYPFYLSGNTVIIANNSIIDCINLGNSTYNEIFKCKNTINKGGVRYITNNYCVVSDSCMELAPDKKSVFTRLVSLQSDYFENVVITNNRINLACNFVFGAGTKCEYRYFLFEDNSINYQGSGPTAHQLLRLYPATKGDNSIIIRNNRMASVQMPELSHGLFAYDCTGYSVSVNDNILYGFLPYGDNETEVYTLRQGNSSNNTVFLGTKTSLVRVSVNRLNINDKIVADGEYSIKMYNNTGDATAHFSFEKQPPVQIISGTGETIMTKSAFKGKRAISVSSGKATYE